MLMPLPIVHGHIHRARDRRRTYVGVHDIYPPISIGLGYTMWYLGLRYFTVSSHIHSASGVRVEFWPGSYAAYSQLDGSTHMGEVLYCMVDSRDGRPIAICRRFLVQEDIVQASIQILEFIHSTSTGRTILQQEVFYTTDSFLCHVEDKTAVVDCFFTRRSYREWSGRIPLHMAYFCEYVVHTTISTTVWQKLCNRGHEDAVLRRLGSSRAFSIHGVLPSAAPALQRHVRVVIFLFALAHAIYDRLLSVRHSFVSLESSYIDCICDSDMWSTIFILEHCEVLQCSQYIHLKITGYELLRHHFFYGWTNFPIRYVVESTDVNPRPPLVRLDPTMSFTFYGMSKRTPHLRVGFTCARYVWHPTLHHYESIGVVRKHFSV